MITMLITDLSGKLVLKKVTNTGNGESIIPLNVSKLSAGTYFLKMFTADGKENAVKKFVKL
ncbi:MAG: T9SS type A sorting domain-containing protein [Segetibacter sp.]